MQSRLYPIRGYVILLSVMTSTARAATGLDGCLYWIDNVSKSWSPAQWEEQIVCMKKAGFNHVILCGSISASTQPADNVAYAALDRFMDACKGSELRVYLSLKSHPIWYVRWNLEEELSANRAYISSTATRYEKHPNFAGWYIPHEIYVLWNQQSRFIQDLYTGLSELCKQRTPNKKVILSPFFILDRGQHFGDFKYAEPDEYEEFWYDILSRSQIDIIALQDSGEHLSFFTMADRRPFFAAMKRACDRAGKTLWINIETGELQVDSYEDYVSKFGLKVYVNDPRTAKSWHVVAPDKLRTKLKLAREFADTTTTWGYYPYWDPMRGDAARTAYDAYLANPDMEQRSAQLKSLRWGMFICWSFSTFSGKEWTPGIAGPEYFKSTNVDVEQWVTTAKDAGMGYILFLTKHHDGFCLWDTQTTDRKVTKAQLGRDVLAELRKACDKHGIKLALYFSEGDWTWPGAVDGTGGKGGSNPEMKKAQLKELLTGYGPIQFIWFDHAVGTGGLSHKETAALVKSLQPGCFVGFNNGDQEGADIRLGERGRPGTLDDMSAAGFAMNHRGSGYKLAEFTYPILPPHEGGAQWFYSLPKHDGLCLPAEHIYADYLGAVKYDNIFSLDVGPDYNGRLRDIDVKTLRQVGRMIREKAPMPDIAALYLKDAQEEFLKCRFGMFIHFNLATFVNTEWATGHEDPLLFKPDKLNCGQWADAAKAAGMKYGVLTVKHTEGYPLWNSGTTTHDITAFKNYKNGKGDIVAEFVKAFRSRGLKVGLYYCFPGNFSENRLAEDQADLHGLPPEAVGDYTAFIKKQLTELLVHYGPIDLLWCDQYSNPYTKADWQRIKAHVKTLQPRCLVIGNNAHDLADTDILSYEFPWKPILPPEGNTTPAEVCDTIQATWFWHPRIASKQIQSAEAVVKMLKLCNSRHANYLLNVPPNRDGLIPDEYVERLRQVGALISNE